MSDEPLNPKLEAEEQCKPKCTAPWHEYQKCVTRITDEQTGNIKPGKHCQGYYLDFWNCVDKCALPIYAKKVSF